MNLMHPVLNDISIDRIREHIIALQGVRHPVVAPVALRQAEEYIRRTLKGLGYEMLQHSFTDCGTPFSNVVATRSGAVCPEQRVMLIAHFDTVSTSPGADDNASGVAVLLEVATLFQQLEFEKTLHFVAVNLEENSADDAPGTGTRGSRALARHAREQGWDLDAVVVLESVAFAGPDVIQEVPPGLPIERPEAGDFIAVVGNEASLEVVQRFVEVVERQGIPLPCLPAVVPGNGEMVPDTRRSDHAPFWDQGFRAIMLTDSTNFRNPHYHLASDTIDTLNLPFAAEVGRGTGALLLSLADPVSVPGQP